MKRLVVALLSVLAVLLPPMIQAAASWTEGSQYERLTPAQRTSVPPGKVEVMEVFSYGCPSCNAFQAVMAALKHDLPSNALPASFKPDEDWPMLQRAYFTAQALGIAERTHQDVIGLVRYLVDKESTQQ